jgi:hypothetical protein
MAFTSPPRVPLRLGFPLFLDLDTAARRSVKVTRTAPLKMNGLTLANGTFIVTSKKGLNCLVVEFRILLHSSKTSGKLPS